MGAARRSGGRRAVITRGSTRRLLAGAGVVGVVAVGSVAYVWTPGEVRGVPSAYLARTPTAFADTPRVRFHYRREGTGPAVLLLHGGGTWSYSYRDTVEVLAKRYTVIAVDLPGHGYTEVTDPAFEYDLPAVTDALRDLLDELDVPDVAAVGHSWGGGIALAMAQRHPSRVRRLALIGSSGLDVEDTLTWRLLGTPVVGEILSKLVRRQDVRSGLEQSFHHRDLVDDAMVDEVWPPLTFTGNRRAQYLLQRRLDWTQTQAALPGTATPTLVLWGRQDAYLSADHAARFQELMPDARAQVIDQCGHSAHEECPDEVNTALLKFLT